MPHGKKIQHTEQEQPLEETKSEVINRGEPDLYGQFRDNFRRCIPSKVLCKNKMGSINP